MNIVSKPYTEQNALWPQSGKHILARYDEDTVVVYQAYRHSIGQFAASHQYFGGDFSYSRMSWIKPNFLWMMYRSGWGTKAGQEVILAIRLKRSFFDQILEQAVISSFTDNTYFEDKDAWKKAVKTSDVRLQWDPDHNPSGLKQERKAVQLGLRNDVLKEYGRDAIVDINDISDYVAEQRVFANGDYQDLMMPEERVYIPSSERASQNIDLTINTNR